MVADSTTIAPAVDAMPLSVDKISTVVPATPTDDALRGPMFLSSCDLVCRSYPYINRIFFFDLPAGYGDLGAGTTVTYDDVVSLLRAGLSKALVMFYPLAGRFVNDADGRLQVDCNDRGVEFVEASVDTAFSELRSGGFQYSNLFWNLVRRTNLLRSDYFQFPILSVQITKFADGAGVAIGVSLSHAVADAQSFYDFVRTWSEISRGASTTLDIRHMRKALSVASLRHVADSVAVDDIVARMKKAAVVAEHVTAPEAPKMSVVAELNGKLENDARITKTKGTTPVSEDNGVAPLGVSPVPNGVATRGLEANGVTKHGGMELQADTKGAAVKRGGDGEANGVTPRGQAPIMEKQLHLEDHRKPRTDLVQKVFSFTHEKLQRLKEKAASEGKTYTTFESFCSHWWQSLIRARVDLPEGQNVFLLIPINCRKRFLGLPEGYFGNSLDGGMVRMTAGELRQSNLPEIAAKIHAAIAAVTEDSFRQYILQAEARRNAIPHFDRTGLFHVVDSPKYPVYDTDFGFGRPAAVRAEGFRFGAEVQILAGRLGLGSFDMFCALDGATMKRLERDPHFLGC